MRKKVSWSIPVLLLLMACVCSVPSVVPAPPTPTSGSSTNGEAGRAEAPGFVTVRLSPNNGNLMKQLSGEVQKATANGLKPFVEWDAEW